MGNCSYFIEILVPMINLSFPLNWLQKIKNFFFHQKQPDPAVPSYFNVVEEYAYKVKIAKALAPLHIPQQSKEFGLIEIIVPNNEWEKINNHSKSIQDVIVFNPGGSNLQNSINENSLLLADNSFTLQHMLYKAKENYRTFPTRHQNTPQSYRIELQYTPEMPKISPVTVTANMYDEATLTEVIERIPPLEDEELINCITIQNVFFNFLRLQLQFNLILPKGFELSPDALCISEISLKWPIMTSSNQFYLNLESTLNANQSLSNRSTRLSPHEIAYNPATKSLFLGEIGFEAEDTSVGKYQTPFIYLDIFTPSELYKEDYKEFHHIYGNAIIKIPKLLSGLTFDDVGGEMESDLNVCSGNEDRVKRRIFQTTLFEEWSKIRVEFDIEIARLFERRDFSPYQHLEFPNVILNEMRLVDIRRLLQDMQFNIREVHRQYTNRENKTLRRVLLKAWQPQGVQNLQLWLVVEGKDSRTRRRKEIPGNEQYTSSFPTGNMKIYIWGQIEGDREQIVQIITDIHNKLKEIFKYVTVIE